ncbi:glycoside hydrolase family 16 [Mucilaginibacter paludis DSM 18603]|uniref:Glycoside hydrolase family 16 n=2 Tax=Mucilaginibacter TaxID=423349 RepID=H1YIE3_9SPHI|nr:glycoside hydrolase family 16 [Mucilaginibacter paludis DSM 18603]
MLNFNIYHNTMRNFARGCILLSLFLMACSKASSSSDNSALPPTNLTVNAVAAQDSSGNVSITAKASNATTYDIDFGNGVIQTVPSGSTTYKYTAAGTYTINVVAKSASGQTLSANTNVTVAIKVSLVWSDEFNVDGAPDPNKWGYDIGTGSGGWGNSELEYYTNRAQNAYVQGGTLKIVALKENYSGSAYTSAKLLSKNKYAFTYGHIDIRAKLPSGQGPWPALWMLGSNIDTAGWPACGEMDIMEANGANSNKIYGTLHYPGHSGANGNGNTLIISNATTAFHVYSLDWSPSAIKIYVDNQLFQTVANSSGIPFNHDFFFIMNLAIGGTFGGSVDPAFNSATMEVDYIRVYK